MRPAIRAALDWLAEAYPALFTDPPKPLVYGAHQVILLDPRRPAQVSANGLRGALRAWVRRPEYLTALVCPGAYRFWLDGTPAHRVLRADANAARSSLSKLRRIRERDERRAAKQASRAKRAANG